MTVTELGWWPTTHTKDGAARTAPVPGHEFAGVIEKVGPGVSEWSAGDEIFGMNDWFADGATAEFCITRPEWIARMPASLMFQEAASVPISALTAREGLYDRANLQRGETVLIHGGAGGVGVWAIQLAALRGAKVIATAGARSAAFLMGLGAERVIDYRTEKFEQLVRDVDVVFDAVGGETLKKSWSVLAEHGRLVTIAADSENTNDEREKKAFFIVKPNGEQLRKIAGLIDAGKVKAIVDTAAAFPDAGDAYTGKAGGRTGRGKVVISI